MTDSARQLLRDQVGLQVAFTYSSLSTCPRRQVGCLLVDAYGRPLSVGYNGVPPSRRHCTDHACPGRDFPSGQGLELCEAIHAEQNAILQVRDPDKVHTAYVTAFPCHGCIKLFLGLQNCTRLVFAQAYPHGQSEIWWREAGREIIHLENPPVWGGLTP